MYEFENCFFTGNPLRKSAKHRAGLRGNAGKWLVGRGAGGALIPSEKVKKAAPCPPPPSPTTPPHHTHQGYKRGGGGVVAASVCPNRHHHERTVRFCKLTIRKKCHFCPFFFTSFHNLKEPFTPFIKFCPLQPR